MYQVVQLWFVLATSIVYREEGDLRWRTISSRLWLQNPRSPKTGEVKKRLWWWLVPMAIVVAALDKGVHSSLDDLWVRLFPFLAEPAAFKMNRLLSPEMIP